MNRYCSLFIIVFFIFSCKKEELSSILIETSSPVQTTDSIKLMAKISGNGTFIIKKAGFIISISEQAEYDSSNSILANKIENNNSFEKTLFNKFEENNIIYLRAFLVTENSTLYGNIVEFTGNSSGQPVIEDFTPKEGIDGDYVMVNGHNFGTDKSAIKLFLGGLEAKPESVEDDKIIFVVPYYNYTDSSKIQIIKKQKSTVSSEAFRLYGPVIDKFSPMNGKHEFEFSISGNNFSEAPWRNIVSINNVRAEVVESSKNEIKAKFNTGSLMAGNYRLIVTTENKSTISKVFFTIESSWSELPTIPISGITNPVSFSIENNLYITTGSTNWTLGDAKTDCFLEYNTSSNQWTKKTNFPGGKREDAAGFSIGNKGYVISGMLGAPNYNSTSDFWEYDPSIDNWTQKDDFPGGAVMGAISFSYNNKAYFGLGSQLSGTNYFWKYDPSLNSWEQLADFPGKTRYESCYSVLNGNLYLMGGYDMAGMWESDIWEYNFSTDNWTSLGDFSLMPIASVVYDNKMYLINYTYIYPDGNPTLVLQFLEFDPISKEIVNTLENFIGPERRSGCFVNVIDNKLYLGGGNYGGFGECQNDFWSYTF